MSDQPQKQSHAAIKKQKNTKFPVARIKKIMQMDDEVGKVAQATPVLISKALELFMQALVDETIKITQEKGAKKMTAQHLKQTISNTEQFDFLTEIADKIPAPSEDTATKKRRGRKSKTNEDKEDSVKDESAQAIQEDSLPAKQEDSTSTDQQQSEHQLPTPAEQQDPPNVKAEQDITQHESQTPQQLHDTLSNE
ncbi:hypothetical protein E3P98_02544 [Wallemia ichthyophaga]|nr:hypothetical protein E3P98_02544 [Wallemia ichthyophaga]